MAEEVPSTSSTSPQQQQQQQQEQEQQEQQQAQQQQEPQHQQQQQQQQQQQRQGYCVGIDLGSSSSVVAAATAANPLAVSIEVNRLANRSTPSAIAFDGVTRVVGEEAESRLSSAANSCLEGLGFWLSVTTAEEAEGLAARLPYCYKPQVVDTPQGLSLVLHSPDGDKYLPITIAIGHYLRVLISFAAASRGSTAAAAAAAAAGAGGGSAAAAAAAGGGAAGRKVTHLSGLLDSSVVVDGFINDEEDLHLPLSRQLFEDICKPLKENLLEEIREGLKKKNLSTEEIIAVEVVGGGSRIPWVAAALEEAFSSSSSSMQQQQQQQRRSKLRRTLDGGSSVAMGAAMFAAGSSYINPIDLTQLASQLQQQQIQELRNIDQLMVEKEEKEQRRLQQRNKLETFLLEMQAAARRKEGASLLQQHVQQLLQEKEHWLLDNAAAAEEEFAAALQQVEETIKKDCKEYFIAIEEEKKKKEQELQEAAAAAAAANAAAAAAGGGEDMDVKLPNSQCIKRAKKNKDEANELFKDGNIELAVQRYIKGLQYLSKVFDLNPKDEEETKTLKLSLQLNLAQAYLKLAGSDPKANPYEPFNKKALASCDAALEI
ncbi:DnaK family domain containing protein, putative, partial [Eimeria maxima]